MFAAEVTARMGVTGFVLVLVAFLVVGCAIADLLARWQDRQ